MLSLSSLIFVGTKTIWLLFFVGKLAGSGLVDSSSSADVDRDLVGVRIRPAKSELGWDGSGASLTDVELTGSGFSTDIGFIMLEY